MILAIMPVLFGIPIGSLFALAGADVPEHAPHA
jgi:hypothetical protein